MFIQSDLQLKILTSIFIPRLFPTLLGKYGQVGQTQTHSLINERAEQPLSFLIYQSMA